MLFWYYTQTYSTFINITLIISIIQCSIKVQIKSLPFDGKFKKVSSLCCSLDKDIVWIGTEGGNVYQLNLKNFLIKEPIIFLEDILDKYVKF